MTSFSNNAWLPKALFDAGLKVSEVTGWQTRGRRLLTIRGVICHHTASPPGKNMPSLSTLIHGRSDLPGPLCQVGLGRDGTCYVVAAGAANHAGRGVTNYVDLKGNRVTITDGNGQMLGVEAENSGTGEAWSDKQLEAYVGLCAAICRKMKLPSGAVAGHKEYALPVGRKIDPAGFSMVEFRHRVAAVLGDVAPKPEPIPPDDGDGQRTVRRGMSGDDVKTIQKAVGAKPVDGEFGSATEAKVRAFQRSHGLTPDGVVGPKTWSSIHEADRG
jgi:hypothetical protein